MLDRPLLTSGATGAAPHPLPTEQFKDPEAEDWQGDGTVALRRPAARPARVLVAEDEPGIAEVLALHLNAAGYEVHTALDGLQALYLLERAPPDLVVLDLNLPHVSGFRLLQLLRRPGPAAPVPVLVLTALSFQEAREVVQLGAEDFIEKPFWPPEVVARARRLLAMTAPRRGVPAA